MTTGEWIDILTPSKRLVAHWGQWGAIQIVEPYLNEICSENSKTVTVFAFPKWKSIAFISAISVKNVGHILIEMVSKFHWNSFYQLFQALLLRVSYNITQNGFNIGFTTSGDSRYEFGKIHRFAPAIESELIKCHYGCESPIQQLKAPVALRYPFKCLKNLKNKTENSCARNKSSRNRNFHLIFQVYLYLPLFAISIRNNNNFRKRIFHWIPPNGCGRRSFPNGDIIKIENFRGNSFWLGFIEKAEKMMYTT